MDIGKAGALAGMVGSVLFVSVFTIEGYLRPGYDPGSMFVSELSLGPRGWIQIANFITTGLLVLLFTRAIAAEFKAGKASKAGPILLTVIGFSLLVSGPLVMDPASTPRELMSLRSRLHWSFGSLMFSLSPLSCFVFWRRFRRDAKWRSLAWWTLAVAVITSAAVVLMSIGPKRPPASANAWSEWSGLIQRAVLIPYFAWLYTFAVSLYRRRARVRDT